MPEGVAGSTILRRQNTVTPAYVPWASPLAGPYRFLAGVDQKWWDARKQFLGFEVDFLLFKGGQTRLGFVPIQQRSGFLATAVMVTVSSNANPPLPIWPQVGVANAPSNYMIQLRSTKARFDWFSQPVPVDNLAAGVSGGMMAPTFLENGEVLTIRLQSLWLFATTHNVRVTVGGAYLG